MKSLFKEESGYICKTAKTPLERMQLIEQEFEFVKCVDNLSYYRKKKCLEPVPKVVEVPRAGFEPATTEIISFSDYEQFLRDLEDFKLFAKSKLNFSQGTVYHYSSKLITFMRNRKSVTEKDIMNYIEKKKTRMCP